jgi:lipoate-protein ligase A
VELVEQALLVPTRQPDYRANRSHRDFIANLKAPPDQLKSAIAAAWNARPTSVTLPLNGVARLAREKYESKEWNERF